MRPLGTAARPSPRRTAGRRALTALHLSALALSAFVVCTLGLLLFPEGRQLIDEHFGVVRIACYLAWAVGVGGFALAPGLLLKEVGAEPRLTLRPARLRAGFERLGAAPVARAFALGAFANVVVLALSPLGAPLGSLYTWPVFATHLVLSGLVVGAASLGALVRMRDFVDELRPVPAPRRASHVAPAGGL
ncbi:MAG: hypothetical protein IT383_12010 [Deltaproteobacteria bacterium]|nr:hypothetical protein [Deltaproteobacteria bacterium]